MLPRVPAPAERPAAGGPDAALAFLSEARAVERLWDGDHTLWQPEPAEVADRLGWLHEPLRAREYTSGLSAFADDVRADGIDRVVWCGMGGSSLFPMLLADLFGAESGLSFTVLDTSHPAAVARVLEAHDERVLYCFASKSGGTVETRSQLDALWAHAPDPSRFVVVTDAGSSLDGLAAERGFRARFHANPEIGGRFSALSHFGLVPAALLGAGVDALLASAIDMAEQCATTDLAANPGALLAAHVAGGARHGRDKCTVVTSPGLGSFGPWLEQLVAESTGKHGTGILPVVDEPLGPPEVYGDDRLFVAYDTAESAGALGALAGAGHPVLSLGEPGTAGLGAEVVRWEVATALAGAVLGINPFDQPDVEAAKRAATAALEGDAPPIPVVDPATVLATIGSGDYVAIQAFLDPADPVLRDLERVRVALRARHRTAVTVGVGPRYLHSTGQLHKGGPPTGVFLQVLDPGDVDVAVPGRSYGFAALLTAQADGDYRALAARGRRVARVTREALTGLAP